MTKYVNVWTTVIIFGYILQPIYTDLSDQSVMKTTRYGRLRTTHTSKACRGTPGLKCTRHNINCNSTQKIAIYDAYYTDNTECGGSISNCQTLNPDNVTEQGYHRFSNSELVSLYGNCSTKSQCGYRAQVRSFRRAFSVVKYRCIGDGASFNITGGSVEGLHQVSLTNRNDVMANSTIQNKTYVCSFKSVDPTTRMSVYSLDVRMRGLTPGQCLSRLTVLPENYITTTNCSTLYEPFDRLNVSAMLPRSIYLDIPSVSSTLIWLLVNASSPFDVKCEPVTNTEGFTTESATQRSPPISPSQIPVGVFMGGVATGAVIVILVGLSVYFLVIRRRYDLTAKKQSDVPASVEHPTYSGLSARTDTNNYAIIEQPARSEEDTTRGTTATQDYQNI